MTLSADSFDDLKSYKKDLHKTLRTCLKSKYSLVKFVIDGKSRDVLVCGKNHDDLMKALELKQKKVVLTPGWGQYEAGTFHPISGKAFTDELLSELGVSDVATVYSKTLADEEEIPNAGGVTLGQFKEAVNEARKLLPSVSNKPIQLVIEKSLQRGEELLLQFKQQDYGGTPTVYADLKNSVRNHHTSVRLARELAHWQPIAARQNPKANEHLLEALEALALGKVSTAEQAHAEGMSLFKGTVAFESTEKIGAENDEIQKKIESDVATTAGPGALYAKAKAEMILMIKEQAGDRKKVHHEEAKTVAKLLPALFKNDMKDKLEAVHKARGKRLDDRKPLIEKALMPLRQYLKAIQEMNDKADLAGTFTKTFVLTLERIQTDLLEDYRSKPEPSKK